MVETRMGLKEAGELLGLTPNAVRARAKGGKIRHEKDNLGKWWVFLDPEQAANDRVKTEAQKPEVVTSNEGSNNLKFEGEISALRGHIESLQESLDEARSERDRQTGRAEASEATLSQARVHLAQYMAKSEHLEAMKGMLERQLDDFQKQALPASAVKREGPSWFGRLWGRGKRKAAPDAS